MKKYPKNNYPKSFRKKVVLDRRNNNLSISQTAKKYNISDGSVSNWCRAYRSDLGKARNGLPPITVKCENKDQWVKAVTHLAHYGINFEVGK